MTDPTALIEECCYLALRLGLAESPAYTNCLVVRDGVYMLSPDARTYHPLEAVLIGEPAGNSTWLADALARLAVSPEWAEGFVDGFAQSGERADGQEYIQGYLTATELTERCFRWRLKRGCV